MVMYVNVDDITEGSIILNKLSTNKISFKYIKMKDRSKFIEKCAEIGLLVKDKSFFYKVVYPFTVETHADIITFTVGAYTNKQFKTYSNYGRLVILRKGSYFLTHKKPIKGMIECQK